MNEFARRIAEARRAKNHSQTRAAETVRVVQSQWSKYELGKALPEEKRWPAFAAYLGVALDELSALVAGAIGARPDRRDPTAQLEAEVEQLRSAVDDLGKQLHRQLGMIETVRDLLGAQIRPPAPVRRASPRRAK